MILKIIRSLCLTRLECRLLKRQGDSMIGYQRLSPKICEDRDYTLRVWKKSWPGPQGLTYLSQWEAANELGPAEQKDVVRVKVCNGTWLLEPDGPAKTHATYSIYSDTGGVIPAFIANHASLTAIKKLYAAIRKQVKDPKYAAASRGLTSASHALAKSFWQVTRAGLFSLIMRANFFLSLVAAVGALALSNSTLAEPRPRLQRNLSQRNTTASRWRIHISGSKMTTTHRSKRGRTRRTSEHANISTAYRTGRRLRNS